MIDVILVQIDILVQLQLLETMCHGCDKDVKSKSIHIMNFDNTSCFICENCMQDVGGEKVIRRTDTV